MVDFPDMHEFLTHFCTLSSRAILSQLSKFSGDSFDAAESFFQLHCVKILTLALSPDYATLLRLGKFYNYITACDVVLTQYMAAVEKEHNVALKLNYKWNSFGKKGLNQTEQPKSMLMELMDFKKHTITPPFHPKPKMACPFTLINTAHMPEKVFPDPSCHQHVKASFTYAQAAAAATMDSKSTSLKPTVPGKRDISSQVSCSE
ncbi:hypothetical protein DSO57_1009437 [Entomophthora muscae]|uniref:Uncharacterized protein n=1 Tax=Entomophthora muscae TaxID=34485 RepID=A0ACC2THG0_9FUNG|nr:hypothetical protein DSO57_1009437 [Entomophthora muscae]